MPYMLLHLTSDNVKPQSPRKRNTELVLQLYVCWPAAPFVPKIKDL